MLAVVGRLSLLVAFVASVAAVVAGCDGGLVGGGGRIYAGGGHFGQSIALDGDRALVGADDTDEAFVLTADGDGWQTEQRLRPPAGLAPEVLYGWTAGLDGDLAAVGAPVFGYEAPGRVYVYERQGRRWQQAAELLPEAPPPGGRLSLLGNPIAVSAGRVAATQTASTQPVTDLALRPATVRIFERTGAGWEQTAELRETAQSAERYEGFGTVLALDGDRLAVGSPGRDVGGVERAGVIEVYEHGAEGWVLAATLSLPEPRFRQTLGNGGLALDGSLLAVSSYLDRTNGETVGGAAYAFRETGGVWALEARLRPPGIGEELYGSGVAADSGPLGDRVAIGATGRARSRGSVFVWVRRPSGTWELEAELWPAGGDGGAFGEGLALEGDRLLVGAIYANGGRGGVYEFRLGPNGWRQVRG